MTDRAAERAITQLDVDSSAAFVNRLEVYDAAVPDSRSLHAPPCQQLVRNLFGHFGSPFNRNPRRPGDYPMRTTVAHVPRLAHIGHKARKILVIDYEIEDPLDRRVDVNRFLHLDRATVIADAQKTFH